MVYLAGEVVARSAACLRVVETSHPPVYYLPMAAFGADVLQPTAGTSWCEFKGRAVYVDLVAGGRRAARAGWSYPQPSPGYQALAGHVALYPARVDRVTVDGEEVRAQEGDFYGGWITSRVVGPFKGGPGSWGW